MIFSLFFFPFLVDFSQTSTPVFLELIECLPQIFLERGPTPDFLAGAPQMGKNPHLQPTGALQASVALEQCGTFDVDRNWPQLNCAPTGHINGGGNRSGLQGCWGLVAKEIQLLLLWASYR